MILLPKERYSLLEEPVKEVPINNLFARSVIEKHVSGNIYVDNIKDPKTFYVVHPYGMSLLFGDYSNSGFNHQFKTYALNQDSKRSKVEWMQAYPDEWDTVLHDLFAGSVIKASENSGIIEKGIIEIHSRVNFRFNKDNYLKIPKVSLSANDILVETGLAHIEHMQGSVIPLNFWDSAGDFLKNGKGFTLLSNGEIASTAYSAFVHEDKLEIGIETVENYRGLGYAELTCSRLIDYCLDNNYIPVWSCRFENTASYRLAQKLGFEPILVIPFYKLNN